MDTLEELPLTMGQYEYFHTIDWLRDIARDRMRHRQIMRKKVDGYFDKVKSAHDAWSGWLCVLLVGFAVGKTCSPARNNNNIIVEPQVEYQYFMFIVRYIYI